MGVITKLTLDELNKIFTTYNFIEILPTKSGIIDTTYIVKTKMKSYILKKYERDIPQKIEQDTKLLNELNSIGLNVPLCIENNNNWYLYKKLTGHPPLHVKSYHIQALARFLAKFHNQTYKKKSNSKIGVEKEIIEALHYTKIHFFGYYKKFEFLRYFIYKNEALIHGDIFKDNTIFDGAKIGVIDFIDSFYGTLAFDVGVGLVGFDVKIDNSYLINLFLLNYNQYAPKKLTKKKVIEEMKIASNFYALKRVYKYKNTLKAKELLR